MKSKASPGSIFTRKGSDKLIIKLYGKFYSTGLPDTPGNRKLCEKKMKSMYLKSLGMDGEVALKQPRIKEALYKFRSDHLFNKAPKTVRAYEYAFGKVIVSNIEIKRDTIIEQVKDFIINTEVSLASVEIVLRHYQVFVNWLHENDYLSKPTNIKRLLTKKSGGKLVQTYEEDEIQALVGYWTEKQPEFALLIRFMLATGGRIGETLRLKRADIDDQYILFNNKYDSAPERFPVYDEITQITAQLPQDRESLFRWSDNSTSRLNKWLRESAKELGIDLNGRSFHEFRKTFRRRLFDKGVPLEIASQLLRHRSISTTMKYYTERNQQNLRKHAVEANGNRESKTTAPDLHLLNDLL